MSDHILEVNHLNKTFGGVAATRDVSLSVRRGEIHAIIGPNGAGKTTLISQLSGALAPDSGQVLFNGRDVTRDPPHRRAHNGLARSFQITSVFMEMSALDNVALAVQAHDGHSYRFWRAARSIGKLREPAMHALERVDLAARAAVPASELSHGERRQLEIAMSLATDPSLLLLDEPMAGMGPEQSEKMVVLLDSLRNERSMLLVEHDMDAVFKLADRISVLVSGAVVACDVPDAIRQNEQVQRAYLGEEA